MKYTLALLVTAGLSLSASPSLAAECEQLISGKPFFLEGKLSRPIFPGPPGYEDVRKGDTPEPAYILTLEKPICLKGDEDIDADTPVREVHIVPANNEYPRQLIGEQVWVDGREIFGAITGHHHAPLVMTARTIHLASDVVNPVEAASTVEAFYIALEIGDGESAASNVVPEKRSTGPLSAKELSSYYGAMKQPLNLIGVTALSTDHFRARYFFEKKPGDVCEGSAIVTTRRVGDLNLISSIRAENGC